MHTILANKKKIYVFGQNYYGQLGLGHNEEQNSPQLLELEQEVSQTLSLKGRLDWKLTLPSPIACGAYHTIILGVNNDVLVFGKNYDGQLGLGHNERQNKPQLLMHGEKIHQIACGDDHTVILKVNRVGLRSYLVPEGQVEIESKSYHDVVVFGYNKYGQLGLGHNEDQNKPQLLMHGEEIHQIACGSYHTVILKADHDILVFGDNYSGQLGLGHDKNQNKPQLLIRGEKISQIACGNNHTVIVKANDDVLVFGYNAYDQPCP
jgi:alpha-tubulin suppressor-like RCC1 family protein